MAKKIVRILCGLRMRLFALLICVLMFFSIFSVVCFAASTIVELPMLVDESGAVRSDGGVTDVPNLGDTDMNMGVQAFLSFDISTIPAGSAIRDVVMDFSGTVMYGEPFGSLGDGYIRVYLHDYGELGGEDYFPGEPSGTMIFFGSLEAMATPISDMNVAEALQNKLGSSRFQLRLQFTPPETNNDGKADFVEFHDVIFSVTFEAPVDFSISASPTSQSVNLGVSTSYRITLTSFGGFSEPVSLSVEGLPSGVTAIFDSSTVTPTGTSIVTVSTSVNTPRGESKLTIKGIGGGLTRETTVTLDTSLIPSPLDKTPPVASAGQDLTVKLGSTVTFSAAGSTDNVGIVSYEWDFGDGTTGIGVTTSHVYEDAGKYNVGLRVTDAAGNFNTVNITITAEGVSEAEFPLWVLILIIGLIGAAVVIWYFLKKRKKKEKIPKPVKIKLSIDKTEILADGKSTANITVELLDEKGENVSALTDMEIRLFSSMGSLKKSIVRIPKGKKSEQTILVSSRKAGTITVSAEAKGLNRDSITVALSEKKRYCMHCGTKMPFASKSCPECGKSPPAGVDTKACKNCNAVTPTVAKFCAECGASQPKE